MPTVRDVMTTEVEVVTPTDTLQRAAQMMHRLNVGALPVCNGNEVLGMITDRDIAVRSVAMGWSPRDSRVEQVMTQPASHCKPEQSVESAMKMMADLQVRRLPVIDADKSLVGIVSLGDMAMRESLDTAPTLRQISEPSEPVR